MKTSQRPPAGLVLSGGVALGSYQAGIYDALVGDPDLSPGWIAGSSAGALNGAIIAGTVGEARSEALRAYWMMGTENLAALSEGMARHALNWMSALQSRLFGAQGHIVTAIPRLQFSSFYDLAPTVAFLTRTIDFDRLNGGEIRFTVATTDLETGEAILFDTGKGDRIGIDHILASCGFLPEFAPLRSTAGCWATAGFPSTRRSNRFSTNLPGRMGRSSSPTSSPAMASGRWGCRPLSHARMP